MAARILILNGSPRAGGNTEMLVEAMMEGIAETGNRARKIDLRELAIKPCYGCRQCAEGKGDPCIQKDDMRNVYAAFEACRTVVFASPLYFWTFSAQMKTALDRLFAFYTTDRMKTPQRECALIVAATVNSVDNFAHVVSYYKACLAEKLGWQDRGMVLAGGLKHVGDAKDSPYLAEACKLGRSL